MNTLFPTPKEFNNDIDILDENIVLKPNTHKLNFKNQTNEIPKNYAKYLNKY